LTLPSAPRKNCRYLLIVLLVTSLIYPVLKPEFLSSTITAYLEHFHILYAHIHLQHITYINMTGGLGESIRKGVGMVHGTGEAIRGNINAALDQASGDKASATKNQEIAQKGVDEWDRGYRGHGESSHTLHLTRRTQLTVHYSPRRPAPPRRCRPQRPLPLRRRRRISKHHLGLLKLRPALDQRRQQTRPALRLRHGPPRYRHG
jgi:hypothetical protein